MKLLDTKFKYYLLLILPLLLVACDNDNPPAAPAPVVLTSVQVSSTETSGIPVGYIRQYKALGNYSDNTQKDITNTVAWASSTANATISTAGVATAVSVGSTGITASTDGKTSPSVTLDITVATAIELVIERKQNDVDLPFNRYEQLYAFVRFSDNTVIDVTAYASWTSSQTGIITVDNTLYGPTRGEIRAVANTGNSVITATDPNNGTIMATRTIDVSDATLTEVIVSPAEEVSLPIGVVQEYTAKGLYSDGVTRDIDKSRITWWHNKSDGIARFTADAELTAVSTGDTSINVVDKATLKFKTLPVKVTDAELAAIVTVPQGGLPGGSVQLPNGRTVEYAAYSVFTDSSVKDVTDNTTFTSSDTSIALPISSRKFQGKKVGKVTITALDRNTGMEAKPVDLEITSAVLESLTISPITPPELVSGEELQLTVKGAFSDGSSRDLTEEASWYSQDPVTAEVSNVPGRKGLVRAVVVGSVSIRATTVEGITAAVTVKVN